jgi:hypothetical protein
MNPAKIAATNIRIFINPQSHSSSQLPKTYIAPKPLTAASLP